MRPFLAQSLAAPLGALLPALIQDPRFHDVRLQVEGTDKKSAVTAPMREDGIEAEYLLSEGQLAGVSMALLLAMATTFRWSNWPALLLDDPGQNNDLIHVANLIEVLRTLVAKSGFQVVLSTHDSELAEFMVRKFRNARIAGETLRFRGPDPAVGVIPAVIPW
jgi:DNA repair exonuclease SbcCD ATPase subunit